MAWAFAAISGLLFLVGTPAVHMAGFTAGALLAPVMFAVVLACGPPGDPRPLSGPRTAAVCAAAAGWLCGAAHCFFLAQELTR